MPAGERDKVWKVRLETETCPELLVESGENKEHSYSEEPAAAVPYPGKNSLDPTLTKNSAECRPPF